MKVNKILRTMKKTASNIDKSRRKCVENASKLSHDRFFCKKINRPILDLCISRTECNRDKTNFSAERGGQLVRAWPKMEI